MKVKAILIKEIYLVQAMPDRNKNDKTGTWT